MNILQFLQRAIVGLTPIAEQGDSILLYIHQKFQLLLVYKNKKWRFQKWCLGKDLPSTRFLVCVKGVACNLKREGCIYTSPDGFIVDMVDHEFFRLQASVKMQNELLVYARMTAERVLDNPQMVTSVQISGKKVEACVALWIDGQVRGSMVGRGHDVRSAVAEGVKNMLTRDKRWKPVVKEDLRRAIIEVTVFAPIQLETDIEGTDIDYTKGYMAKHEGKTGMYVPEVFNAIKFENREHFLKTLFIEKGGISWLKKRSARLYTFEVCDFVEREPLGTSMTLEGSMGKFTKVEGDFLNEVNKVVQDAILWIQKIQEKDGNVPPIVEPASRKKTQIDWSRLAVLAYALAEWQKIRPTAGLSRTIEGVVSFLGRYISTESSSLRLYALVYLAHTYISLGRTKDALQIGLTLPARFKKERFQPILCLQVITLINRLEQVECIHTDENMKEFRSLLELKCKENFLRVEGNSNTDSALWAEAVIAFKDSDSEFSRRVAHWLLSHQVSNGSFAQSKINTFAYTRGSGKIFEVLAVYFDRYEEEIKKAHAWLRSMQYSDENTFFIHPDFKEEIIGALRHDYGNPDAWIDSVGHYVFGAARLLSQDKI